MFYILKSLLLEPKLTEKLELDAGEKIRISETLKAKFKRLGTRSIAVREIDAGSNNDCEHEVAALENPVYDANRFGIKVVASPRHADMLLVTGPVTPGMKTALIKAYEACPDPKIVVAVGDGAISGKIAANIAGVDLLKVNDCVPVDLEIPGDPPGPQEILTAILKVLKNV